MLLSHLTVTYESFKHKKEPKSKEEPVLRLQKKPSLAKNQF